MPSSFDMYATDAVEQHLERGELADPPTEEEVMEAIGKLKGGKQEETMLPSQKWWRHAEEKWWVTSWDLFHTAWKEQRVPNEWRDDLLVPIPKKDDDTQGEY